jgi:prepilin-type N-terminal cleavage/methylation domain-containing protein
MNRSDIRKIQEQSQQGFTLIELVIAIAVTGLLGVGVLMAFAQISRVNDSGNAHVVAVKQVENAVHSINRDIQMAQIVTPGDSSGFPVTLSWSTWGDPAASPPVAPETIQIVYSLASNGSGKYNLVRNDGTNSRTIAEMISTASVTPNANSAFKPPKTWYTIQITSAVAAGHNVASETRKIDIVPRPGNS